MSRPRILRFLPPVAAFLLTLPATGEEVQVRYLGGADLSHYECTETVSSFVHRVCYKSADQLVVVLLRNTYYAYCGVDGQTVSEWLSAESKGRFYNQRIKSEAVGGKFACND